MTDPIDQRYRDQMNDLAFNLDKIFNGDLYNRKIGFALFMFEFGKPTGVNYISNANREDMIASVEAWLQRAKGEEL